MLKNLINKFFLPIIRSTLRKPIVKDLIREIRGDSYPDRLVSCYDEMYDKIMRYIDNSQMVGDYLEFGVFKGDTFIIAYRFAQKFKIKSMNFYAFDSFQGLPEIKGIDSNGFAHFNEGEFACSINEFKKNISEKGVDLNKVKIIQGWYNEVLNNKTKKELPIKKAAVIMIDCDLYESTISVLNFIADYLQDGTIIMLDDWFCFRGNPNKGEQRAFREWLENNPSITATEFHKYCTESISFIIHRQND